MFGVMLLLFGAVIFISGTDRDKLREFINKSDESDKFYCYYGKTKREALAAFKKSFGSFKGFVKKEWTIEQD